MPLDNIRHHSITKPTHQKCTMHNVSCISLRSAGKVKYYSWWDTHRKYVLQIHRISLQEYSAGMSKNELKWWQNTPSIILYDKWWMRCKQTLSLYGLLCFPHSSKTQFGCGNYTILNKINAAFSPWIKRFTGETERDGALPLKILNFFVTHSLSLRFSFHIVTPRMRDCRNYVISASVCRNCVIWRIFGRQNYGFSAVAILPQSRNYGKK